MDTWEKQSRVAVTKHPLRMSPFFIPMMISNMASAQVAMRHGLMGPSSTVVTACSTGSDAIGSAFRMLQHGKAEVMVAGGAEAILTPMALGGFPVMKALSTRNDEPEAASRPFSATRDGFVMGEGAGVLVLETLEDARARGAPVLAELAMEAALRGARIDPDEVGYVNAHATSTPVGDLSEVLAFKRVFGAHA